MRILISIAVVLLQLTWLLAQSGTAVIELRPNAHDFGRIMEDGGKVVHRFEFSNTGNAPLSIVNVRTTCGCTTPDWTHGPVQPGGNGYVDVAFDPEGRKGDFHKTIQIQSTAANANMFVTLSGTIVPALRKESLPYRFGGLAVKADQINLGYLYKGTTGTEHLTIANTTDQPLQVSFGEVPDYLILESIPGTLQPGQYGQVRVEYCTGKVDDWDVVIDRVELILNSEPLKGKGLTIIANLREDFRDLTADELLNAPVAQFSNETVNTGTISDRKPVACNFLLTNEGLSDLMIRTIKPSCGCTVAIPEKTMLAPGESTQIEAMFNPEGRAGKFRNGITVVTNDPARYKKFLFIEGFVQTDGK